MKSLQQRVLILSTTSNQPMTIGFDGKLFSMDRLLIIILKIYKNKLNCWWSKFKQRSFSNFISSGVVDDNLDFQYDENMLNENVLKSGCGATLRDQFWHFGGEYYKRQVN